MPFAMRHVLWVLKRLISAAGCCVPLKQNWVTCLKSLNKRETPVAPKALDRAVQVALEVFPMRSRMFREHLSSMAPFAIESNSPFLEFYRRCGGAINDQPIANRPEVGPHLGRPFPVVHPIKDGNVGRDGRVCLEGRHYEKTKSSVTGPSTK